MAHFTNAIKKSNFTYNLIRILRIQLILLSKDIFVKVHEIQNVKSSVLTVAFSFGGITTTRNDWSHGSMTKSMVCSLRLVFECHPKELPGAYVLWQSVCSLKNSSFRCHK